MKAGLYAALPAPLQHVATAAYGARMRWIRRGREFARTRAALAASERLTASELAELQVSELQRILGHALRTTRYYPALFRSLGLDERSIRTPDDLRRLPLLEKSTLFERADELRASGVEARAYHTSGTSGMTLAIPIDDASRQRNYAFFARALAWAGVEGGRSATFAGRPVVPSRTAQPASVWRWNPAMRNRLFSSYHLSPANAPSYSRALVRWAPDYIDSYPSAVATLASLLKQQGLPAPRVRAVITSSETLLDEQRVLVEEVFATRCFDQYGCTEQAVYVSQCERGAYHVHPEYGIVEIVDAAGDPVKPGEPGELVCTSFSNLALPLVRYRIGDVAVRGEAGCACGRAFPTVRQIVGRIDDLLVTPDGRQVGRLDPVFKGRRAIREAQVVQTGPRSVIVRLVAEADYGPAEAAGLRQALVDRLSPEMQIDIELVTAIERTRSGKFQAVINEWARANRSRSTPHA